MNSAASFDFEHAVWPALLADGAGVLLRANPAAVKLFGPDRVRESARLAALWSPDNRVTAEQFLREAETAPAPLTPIKLLVAGESKVFSALVSAQPEAGAQRWLLQLLPE